MTATITPVIHKLKSGATVLVTSPGHGFKFSDGTEAGPQVKAICDDLTCRRETAAHATIKGMLINETRMILDPPQQDRLIDLCKLADLVMVPFPVLAALREQGIRDQFPNVVAMNATSETQRSAPAEKVVDIQNWSY